MFRFTLSTCGILTHAATMDATGPVIAVILGTAGLALAAAAWWSDLRPIVDRMIGLDL